jgi:drug/metabolite transporter (DMT)-like permease
MRTTDAVDSIPPSPRYGERERERRPFPWLPVVLVFALLFWASAFAAIRVGLRGFSPQSLALFRFITASAVLGGVATVAKLKRPSRRDLPLMFVAAVAGIPLYHIALNYAEVKVGAGPAALLINTSPVMAALLAAFALRERVGMLGWVGTATSFAGAAVIAASDGWQFDPRALWVLVAAVGGAVYTVLQKPLVRNLSPLSLTAWVIWIGTAMLLPVAPTLLKEIRTAPAAATWAAVYMGVFPTAIAYALWTHVISRMNVSRAVSFLFLIPALAVVIAWIWLGEVPSRVAIVGGAMVIGGVVLVNGSQAHARRRVTLTSSAGALTRNGNQLPMPLDTTSDDGPLR